MVNGANGTIKFIESAKQTVWVLFENEDTGRKKRTEAARRLTTLKRLHNFGDESENWTPIERIDTHFEVPIARGRRIG